jgi:hypothetical protein
MPITINGSGTVTGISAGGLPDGSITNDDLAGSITDAKLSGTTCKAWVNFNGTGTVAIRASYNVSSITDNGNGDYTVNFTSALTDANYSTSYTVSNDLGSVSTGQLFVKVATQTSSAARVLSISPAASFTDVNYGAVAIFR